MEKFSCGDIKILVCTHIIESGIDIPNANTMIVQYAELFGLAQLYQVALIHLCFYLTFGKNIGHIKS
jgi:transcription-repair coupling factor (superfamily II helicase)